MFTLSGSSNPGELFVVPAPGGKARDLGIAGYEAAWGPARIAWVDLGTIPTSLWTARPDGSDRRKVADVGDYPPAKPAWSADGRLAYVVGQNVIAIVTGTTTQRVHLPFERIASLAWSPDGSRWAVSAQAAGTASYDIYTVRTDGSDPQRLTTDMDAASPSWR